MRSVASWLKAWAWATEIEAVEAEAALVKDAEKAFCKVAKSDCAAERLPDWRSLLSCSMLCW